VTTRRGEDPATGRPDYPQSTPPEGFDDAPQPLPPAPGATRAERRRAQEAAEAAAGRPFAEAFTESPSGTAWPRPALDGPATGPDEWRPGGDGAGPGDGSPRAGTDGAGGRAPGESGAGVVPPPRDGHGWRPGGPGQLEPGSFDPGNTGTWRVRDVVPGADGGRRTTVILRYLLGLLAVDHVRSLARWAFALPPVGLILLLVRPRWIGLAVIVLGVLLIIGRFVAVRLISRHTLPRRYRPVEEELRAAVEAGKANLRGELRRVGMPSSALALIRSVVRLGSSDSRSTAQSRLRDIEIDRVLPRAQLDRALRVLDEAPAPR
jgi:hypothetical protein